MPETLAPVLLRRKAERIRKETGDQSYRTLAEIEHRPFKVIIKEALLRPLIMLVTEPVMFFMSFYLSFIYSILCKRLLTFSAIGCSPCGQICCSLLSPLLSRRSAVSQRA